MIAGYEKLIEKCPALRNAQQQGVDVYMLLDNLRRTPRQRLIRHQAALRTFRKFYNTAGKQCKMNY
jgi:phosphatidylserine/phosphatidylglycerophosphate/cardiolipin synthase-like enzyme